MPAASSTTDRIEKKVTLKARVPASGGTSPIPLSSAPGSRCASRIRSPWAGASAAACSSPGEHVAAEFQIVSIEPEHYFAYRWHPCAVDPKVDYSGEPTTLVEFRLQPAGKETVLTVVESGFDRIPAARRAKRSA